MRYIKGYETHRQTRQEDAVNEELLGLFSFVKKLFGKVKAAINKVKGGKKCEEIYKKYLQIINNEIAKKANIDLSITATLQAEPAPEQKKSEPAPEQKKNESAARVNEAEEPKLTPEEIEEQNKKADEAGAEEGEKNKKIGLAALKEKKKLIEQIITIYKNKAIKEMDILLKNAGGAEKNPKLAQLIDNFKDQFQVDILTAQMKYLEKSGDKNMANKMATEIQRRNKELEAKWNLDRVEFAKVKVGDLTLNIGGLYRYNSSKGVKTIKIKKASEAPGEVMAVYTYGDTKDKEQSFKAANIDAEFVPQAEGEYAYWSNTNNAGIKVKVIGKPDKKGMVDVQFGDNKFKVYTGALVGDGKTVDLSTMNPEAQKPEGQGEKKEGAEGQGTEEKQA